MRYLILTGILCSTACGGAAEKEKQLLNEASTVHNQAVALARDLKVHLDQLETDSTVSVDSVRLWRQLLAQWNEELVEVPGNEHEHDHDHDHDHSHHHHASPDQVTASEMLEIQRDMKRRMEQLNNRIKK
jgi:ABC-type Zn2+ transport system substrate-binding protein/surface adhesin